MMPSSEIHSFPLIHISETNSTNSYLHSLCAKEKVEEMTTVITDFQTSGRGQRGNSWESEPGKNLLFSFVLFPEFLEAKRQFLISQIVSLAIKEELDNYTSDITIKWPNDIYWKDKKICGILIEHELMGKTICQSIAGIGININQSIFHSSAPNPVSLFQITNEEHDILLILGNILSRLKSHYKSLQNNETEPIAFRYANALFRKDGFYFFKDNNGEFLAQIISVETDGRLVLEDENKRKRDYMFKEVEFLQHTNVVK